MKKYPPLIQQYLEIQNVYPQAVIACEVGAFYEIWGIDGVGYAKEASQILDTVLTKRDKSDKGSPDMTGFPSFACDNHFKKLVSAGKTVVVVSQAIKGKKSDQNKSITRTVSQILSPGTVVENISKEKPNFFAAVYIEETFGGLALIDVSTGEVIITEMQTQLLREFLEIKDPSEVLIVGDFAFLKKDSQLLHTPKHPIDKLGSAGKVLASVYEVENPTSNPTFPITVLGLEFWRLGTLAFANLLNYLTDYNSLLLKKVGYPEFHSPVEHLYLPNNSLMSLDVFRTQSGKESSTDTFIGIIDRCRTAMGQRRLREWIQTPLSDLAKIEDRLNMVEEFIKSGNFLNELKDVYDFARLSRRMAIKRMMPHEIVHLANSLKLSKEILFKMKVEDEFTAASEIYDFISTRINLEEADGISELTKEFFQQYLTPEVDAVHASWKKAELKLSKYKAELEKKINCEGKLRIVEKLETFHLTGPKSLTLSAKAASVEIQVKASEIQIIEEEWLDIAKACLALRHQFLAESVALWEKFQLEFISKFGDKVVSISDKIAELDILSCFGSISQARGYSRPKFIETDSAFLNLKAMRHPVVELSPRLSEGFIANDIRLGDENKTFVIYGANSAGKSTILKSVALNIIMAQIGCFIAAAPGSELSVFDNILTRMSSFDSLTDGLSTFTLEMSELQQALRYKDAKSIFLFDEIGRGTSVEDGEAIAFGTLLYLHDQSKNSVTLFATHYHSLVPEISKIKTLTIKSVSCYTDKNGNLVFPRKLEDGAGHGSYGVEVAKSCGLPAEIIRAASRYSQKHFKLKKSRYNSKVQETTCEYCKQNPAQQTHHIVEQLQGKTKSFSAGGQEKSINDPSNLVMLCATCHERITRGEFKIFRKVKNAAGEYYLEKS